MQVSKRSTMGLAVTAAAAALLAGLVGPVAPASAGTRHLDTRDGPQRVEDQNTLAGGTFAYNRARTALTARVKQVEAGTTRVGARISYPGGTVIRMWTRVVAGAPEAVGTLSQHGVRRAVAVDLLWDEETHRVGFVIDNHRGDPRSGNRHARFAVYTLSPGRTTAAPACGPHATPVPWCHDDWVGSTLRRP